MRKKIAQSIYILGILLLAGAGCSSGTAKDTEQTQPPTSTKPIVRKQPVTDPTETALDFCESQGYNIIFTFDEVTKTNDMFCAFTANTGCEALDYYRGACLPSTSVAIGVGLEGLENIRTCDRTELPVCGEDGNTYINQCIANLQQIRIIHTGACTGEDKKTEGFIPTTLPGSTDETPIVKKTAYTQESTLWLNTLANLLIQKKGSKIEKCTFGGDVLYYQEEGCPTCFSTLYNATGSIICFPDNDLAGSCPIHFNKDVRSSCSVIWNN